MGHMTKEQKANLRKQLNDMNRPELISLIKELMRLNDDNTAYIGAKLASSSEMPEAVEYYKKIIRNEFFNPGHDGWIRLSVAKKAITDFKRASGNTEAVLDLLVYYVENGTEYTLKYGDIDERFYYSMESVFWDVIDKLNSRSGRPFVKKFRPRLQKIVEAAKVVGWGYYEGLDGILDELEGSE